MSSTAHGSDRLDLTDDEVVTRALIRKPLEWRVRIVERVEFDTATTCLRKRSVQSAPLRTSLPQHLSDTTAKRALMNVYFGSVPRGPLLEFDVEGPDGRPAYLLPRSAIASYEGGYLREVAEEAGLVIAGLVPELIVALLAHSLTVDELVGDRPALKDPSEYLEAAFGAVPPADVVDRWVALDREAEQLLAPFADARDGLSPTEHPLLGLAALAPHVNAGQKTWWTPIGETLFLYVQLLREASRNTSRDGPGSAASEWINSIADYGRNYDLIALTEVPLDEPFLLKYSDRRDFEVGFRGQTQQSVILADARSNHVVLATTDSSVELRDVRAVTASGATTYGAFTTRSSPQIHAIYAPGDDRDYAAVFQLRLRVLGRLRWTAYAAAGLLALLAIAVLIERPHELRELAVIVGPTSLAASVLLIREPTTLSSRLRRTGFTLVAFALGALLAVSVLSYLWPTLTTASAPQPGVSSQISPSTTRP